MRKLFFAGAGMAVLVSAGCATTVAGVPEHGHRASDDHPRRAGCSGAGQPAAREVDRALRRRAAVRPGEGRALQARARGRDGRERSPRSTRIAADPAPPTFENTIAALERAGRTLDARRDASTASGLGTMSDARVPGGRARDGAEARRVRATRSRRTRRSSRASRRSTTSPREGEAHARAAAPRVAPLHATSCARGAKLDAAAKKRLGRDQPAARHALHRRSARTCSPTRRATRSSSSSEADLAGLPDSLRAGAAAAAEARGQKGKWAITNTRSSMEPFLTYSTRRDLREKVWRNVRQPRRQRRRARQQRRSSPRSCSCAPSARSCSATRRTRTGASRTRMAKTPERAMALMEAVWKPAVARVREEVADMQALADAEGAKHHDRAVGLPLLRREGAQGEVRPRRERGEAVPAAREAARGDVLGRGRAVRLRVHARARTCPVYHPDVRVWEVTDKATGKHVGLWYFDPYARAGKRSGAWMNAYRSQERFDGEVTTIVSNNCQLREGQARRAGPHQLGRRASRCSTSSATRCTASSSNVTLPVARRAPTVARDYVEFPSQLLEHWLATPEVLEPLRAATTRRASRSRARWSRRSSAPRTFNQGFETVEYLSSALVDMKLHLAGDAGRSIPTPSSARR